MTKKSIAGFVVENELGLAAITRLPKAHLHIHLEGSIAPAILSHWSELAGVPEPSLQPWDSLRSFLRELDKVKQLIPDAAAMSEAARRFMHDEAVDGVWWTEPHLNPFVVPDRIAGGDLVDAVLDGLQAGARETGVGFGLILAINRTRPVNEALAIAEMAVDRAHLGVIGLGLSNDENAAPASMFEEAFSYTEGSGLLRVPHAGESAGAESVRDALVLEPHRIMHGIRAIEEPGLIEELAELSIQLDTAPTCNVELGVIDSIEAFPARIFLDAGLPFSVGADCSLLMRTTASLELYRVARAHGLERAEIVAIVEASLRASAAPRSLVTKATRQLQQWCAAT
jgi:adenosine deaminase